MVFSLYTSLDVVLGGSVVIRCLRNIRRFGATTVVDVTVPGSNVVIVFCSIGVVVVVVVGVAAVAPIAGEVLYFCL